MKKVFVCGGILPLVLLSATSAYAEPTFHALDKLLTEEQSSFKSLEDGKLASIDGGLDIAALISQILGRFGLEGAPVIPSSTWAQAEAIVQDVMRQVGAANAANGDGLTHVINLDGSGSYYRYVCDGPACSSIHSNQIVR
ncbi:hypothetical protein [Methylocaldum sp.]|uniref:hypothetical protein n=1 Tax=Methylocaldum sp. TaxID=1969727 RepID=UPI002D3ED381|nr:hypothetical protein [Methylocaldum sp.]HYE35067.1 hypothetical protein [Methylocaldum sp.]